MIFKDYYKILGLETNRVSAGDIKIAYKEQAKKYHPDLNGGNKKFEERFKDINEAYNILSNSSTKRRYDRTWYTHVGRKNKNTYQQPQNSKEAIFTMFFGNSISVDKTNEIKKEKAIKGENILTEVSISIEEAFKGKEKEIALMAVDGKMKKIKVAIPAGIQNNEKIRMIGLGKEGKNGGKNGDLFVKVKIKNDNNYILDGYNILSNLYITPWEAALSTKVNVKTIEDEISIYIPSGIQSGEKIKIEGKGYKDGKGGRGDLILETKIMIPKHPTDLEKELFEKMSQVSKYNPRVSIEKI
ncbi:MAG: DnaJ C-terminal domain-containing protein [Candidatus Scatovivens sp.]